MLKISIHNHSSVFGGQERYATDLALFLEQSGHQVSIDNPHILKRLGRSSASVPSEENTDIHVINGNAALYRKAFARGPKIYVQHSLVDDQQQSPWKRSIRKLLLRLLLRQVDAVIRVSEACLPASFARGKVSTIHNGVPLPASTSPLPDPSEQLRAIMVGGLTSNKNQRAAIKLAARLPFLDLTFVGDGPERESLQTLAQELDVEKRIQWTGFVNDPSPYIRQSHICLILSRFESFPYAMLESMAEGRPVLAYAVGGIPEAIVPNQNGLLATPEDEREIEAQLNRLFTQPSETKRLGQEAYATIEKRFSIDSMGTAFLKVLSRVSANEHLK